MPNPHPPTSDTPNTPGSGTSWRAAPLVAIDLEGTGAHDRDREAIIEIAVVPLSGGLPDTDRAYSTLVDPGRKIAIRRWTPPGVTNSNLAAAPPLADIAPELARRLNGAIIVGHNTRVDWRLLHLRCPTITPAGLLDTLTLSRSHAPRPPDGSTQRANTLTALLDRLDLTGRVNQLAGPDSQPHRALWDAIAAAVLLGRLVTAAFPADPTIGELLTTCGLPGEESPASAANATRRHNPPASQMQLGGW